jgi:glycosyltransferase involved in cell wall biosynthesis
MSGKVQRHLYVTDIRQIISRVQPAVAFIEAEPTSLPVLQWGSALRRREIPFGVQIDENLARPYPVVARLIRRWATAHAAFAAARSPTAARLLNEVAPSLPTPLIPHHVPGWTRPAIGDRQRPFTVGYAGRFVPEKGLDDLVRAVSGIPGARARLVGNGPLLGELQRQASSGAPIDIVCDATHEHMDAAYARFDVLVLPSRTTPTWVEQFGRVLVEALSCGVPVVGSSSGEIPWVVESTGGGVVFPEGDYDALRRALLDLRDDPDRRERLAAAGRAAVESRFSVPAVARVLSLALTRAVEAPRTA